MKTGLYGLAAGILMSLALINVSASASGFTAEESETETSTESITEGETETFAGNETEGGDKPANYDLWLGSTGVTDLNKDDILGDGGSARFDPETHTLTVNDVSAIRDAVRELIDTGLDELIIEALDGLNISGNIDYGINSSGSITVNGDFSSEGFLHAINAAGDITVNGDVSGSAGLSFLSSSDGNVIINGKIEASAENNVIFAGDSVSIAETASLKSGSKEAIKAGGAVMISGDTVLTCKEGDFAGIESAGGAVIINGNLLLDLENTGAGIRGKSFTAAGNITGNAGNGILDIFDGDAIVLGDIYVTVKNSGCHINISNGSLTVTGDFNLSCPDTAEAGCAVFASGDITLGGNTEIAVNSKTGICSSGGSIKILSGTADINAAETAILAKTEIALSENHSITFPVNGKIDTVSVENGEGVSCYKSVTEETGGIPSNRAVFEKSASEYPIDSGAGSVYTKETGESLVFSCYGETLKLTGVYIDGEAIGEENYETKGILLVLTLKADYLETLNEGSHTVKFTFSDADSDTAKFSVVSREELSDEETPETGSLEEQEEGESAAEASEETESLTEEETEILTEEETEDSAEETVTLQEEMTEASAEETHEALTEKFTEEAPAEETAESEEMNITDVKEYKMSAKPFIMAFSAGIIAVWITLAIALLIRRKR